MMQFENVSYETPHGKVILNQVSLELMPAQITTLIGPNGVGKSTLLHLALQTLHPSQGTISPLPAKVAFLSQQNTLYEPLTVMELLQLPTGSVDRALIDALELSHQLEQPVQQLSGGQQQLVWLAYALNQHPDLLILDEPTTYLDLHYQQLFLKVLKAVQTAKQMTVLMVLHDLNQAYQTSDQLWLMQPHGKLLAGTPMQLSDPALLSQTFNTPLQQVNVAGQPYFLPV